MENDKKELFKFASFLSFIILLFITLLFYKEKVKAGSFLLSLLPLLSYLIFPCLLKVVRCFLIKAGHVIGTINSYIILFIIFYFILTPLAWIKKMIKGRSMPSVEKNITTYWDDTEGENSFERQF